MLQYPFVGVQVVFMGNPSIKLSCFNLLLVLIKEEQLKTYKVGRKGFTAAYIPVIPVLFIIIFFYECNTTEPIEDIPGRRDYVWTTDTLKADNYFFIAEMWGASPNDIWAVAAGVSYKDCLWHYNGEKWTKSDQWLSSGLYSIFGFSENEIWAGDSYSTIWKYNGTNWYKFKLLTLDGYDRMIINHIYGNTPNNLYAVGAADNYDGSGYKGIILKYNGNDWEYLNIPDLRVSFYSMVGMSNGNYLIGATNFDNESLEKIFVFDGSKLKEIYSGTSIPTLHQINNEAYITLNKKIYKCKNNRLELWKDFSSTIFIRSIFGRSEKDFFVYGDDGKSNIMHYNGTDLQTLYTTEFWFYCYAVFEKDIFVFAEDPTNDKKIIIRGTLPE